MHMNAANEQSVGSVDASHTRLFRHNPKSFLKLIIIGFSLVLLPLIIALINSGVTINQLAKQSRQAVYQATQIAHSSRVLADEITVMERSARQAAILGDEDLLEGYFQGHEKFTKTATTLAMLNLNDAQARALQQLQQDELSVYMQVKEQRATPEKLNSNVTDFSLLLDAARHFSTEGYSLIEHEADTLQIMASQARTRVIWQLLALIPFVIILALGFSVLITRPIRQIELAIKRMGQGQLNEVVHVEGPEDLKNLGEKLDWMREQLLAVETQKVEFLQHVSHELKTPLTAIREGADLLKEGVLGTLTPKQQQVANILHSNSMQLQRRIEDLLSYSALQQQKSMLVKARFSLNKIVDAVLHDHSLALMNKSIQLDLHMSEFILDGDEVKIKTVLDNLLSNAIKFSPPGGQIQIHAQQVGNLMQLDVIDTGKGIDEADETQVFEPFYQGRRVAQGYTQGTGLGLAIARSYTQAHGGSLVVMPHVEIGAHFRLVLPLTEQGE